MKSYMTLSDLECHFIYRKYFECNISVMQYRSVFSHWVCIALTEHCQPGQFYSRDDERCMSCPRDSYQPIAGQNFCIDCPGYTQTDTNGANSSSQCKGTVTYFPTSLVCTICCRQWLGLSHLAMFLTCCHLAYLFAKNTVCESLTW